MEAIGRILFRFSLGPATSENHAMLVYTRQLQGEYTSCRKQ